MNKPIILLISAKAQHGKDTFAKFVKDRVEETEGKKVLIIKYGDILKNVCKMYYGWNGEKDEIGRTILQQVGTNLCRQNNPDVWVNCVIEIVKGLKTDFDYVCVPDTRFPNEIEAWERNTNFYTYTIRLERVDENGDLFDNGLTDEQKQHPSETALDNYYFNYVVENKNILDIEAACSLILEDIEKIEKKGVDCQ